MRYLETKNAIKWHYSLKGKGEALLFIHGWGANLRIWSQQLEYFSRNFKVIAVDLPGHGKSSWRKAELKDIAEDIDELSTVEQIDSMTIIGSSLGGLIGLKYADFFRHRVKRLVFVGSLPKFTQSKEFPFGLSVARMHKLKQQVKADYPGILNVFFRSLFTIKERESGRIQWLLKFNQQDDIPRKEALQYLLSVLEKEDLRKVLNRLPIPIQFINGRHDYISSADFLNYIKKIRPKSKVNIFDDCGHFPFLTEPKKFNSLLEEFIRYDNRKS